jgi:transcriptional regulator with XRE-family HTH domain
MELLRRREATGMSREEVARQLEWSTSTLFRIETGRSRPQPGNVRTLLELYGVTGAERDGLIQLTREARQPGWWHSFRDVLPNPYEVYIGLEAGAASIRNFEPIVVPGLLQTADYARETFRNGPIELDPDEVERLLEVRLARQEILARDERLTITARRVWRRLRTPDWKGLAWHRSSPLGNGGRWPRLCGARGPRVSTGLCCRRHSSR